jgi:hypothetical protein
VIWSAQSAFALGVLNFSIYVGLVLLLKKKRKAYNNSKKPETKTHKVNSLVLKVIEFNMIKITL